jgi:MFS family permease
MAYYLTKWYRKSEISSRIGLYYFASPFSGIVVGFISAAVQLIDGAGGLYGWKWLFVIFGVFTFLVGVFVLFWLPSSPAESKKWLTADQKKLATERLLLETQNADHWRISDLLRQLTDYKVYLFGILYLCPVMVSTSLQYYLPTILAQLLARAYGPSHVNGITVSLLAIPPNFMVIVSAILITYLSDRYKQRAYGIIVFQLFTIIGLIILTFGKALGAQYVGALITGFGIGPLVPLSIGWTTNSKDGSVNVAAATAIVSSIAQIGSIVSTYALYEGWPSDKPQYIGSNMINVGLSGLGIVAAVILKLDFIRLNKQIDEHGETTDGRRIKYLH